MVHRAYKLSRGQQSSGLFPATFDLPVHAVTAWRNKVEIKTYSCPGVSSCPRVAAKAVGWRPQEQFTRGETAATLYNCLSTTETQWHRTASVCGCVMATDDVTGQHPHADLSSGWHQPLTALQSADGTSSSWSPAFVVFSTHNVPFLIARESPDDRRKLSMSVNACAEVCVVATWRVVVLKAVKADDRTEGSSRSVCSQPAGLALNEVVVNFILSSFYLFFPSSVLPIHLLKHFVKTCVVCSDWFLLALWALRIIYFLIIYKEKKTSVQYCSGNGSLVSQLLFLFQK